MKEEKILIEIPSKIEELKHVASEVEKISEIMKFTEDECDNISIGLTEVVNNAIIHGNKFDDNKTVKIEFTIIGDELKIEVTDQGEGFNPHTLDNPLEPENLLKEHGRGIFILKAVMDSVDFHFSSGGTKVTMVKKKKR